MPKTYMPPKKPAQIILYHVDHKKGKTFTLEQAEKNYNQMVKDGWVDSPIPIGLEDLEGLDRIQDPVDPTMTEEELVQAVKSLGYIVSLPDDDCANDQQALLEKFYQNTDRMSEHELIELGKFYNLKLKRTMNEATMIGRISQAIEDSKQGE